MSKAIALGVGLMIGQAACGGRAANPDGSGGSAGSSGGAGGGGGTGGTGGAVVYECYKQGGSCLATCPGSSCSSGFHVSTLACPVNESNALCSPNLCCHPNATTDAGGMDTAAASYACGSATCTTGQTLCYSFLPGVPGG